jgi:hypothetical protein
MPVRAQQLAFGGEDLILAGANLIVIMAEENGHL